MRPLSKFGWTCGTSPETTLAEIGDAKDEPSFDPRLMLLVEGGVWQKRVAVGRLAAPREFSFSASSTSS